MIVSRVSPTVESAIPEEVRRALRLGVGDLLTYEIDGERVILRKAPADAPADDPFANFDEWDGEADQAAYNWLQLR